jgi:hypothetical protein
MSYKFSYIDAVNKNHEELELESIIDWGYGDFLSIEIMNKNSIREVPFFIWPNRETVLKVEEYINLKIKDLNIDRPFRLITFNNITGLDVLDGFERNTLKREIIFFDKEYCYFLSFYFFSRGEGIWIDSDEISQDLKHHQNDDKLFVYYDEILSESEIIMKSMKIK